MAMIKAALFSLDDDVKIGNSVRIREPQDHCVSAAKIVAVTLSLVIAGPWIGGQLVRFTETLFTSIALVGR